MASRSDGDTKVAIEERQLRQMMQRFVEASLTMELGAPSAAADEMAEALKLADSANPTNPGPVDAARLLAQADGFDVKTTLRDSVHAFKVLSDLAANRPKEAVSAALQATTPELFQTSPPPAIDDIFDRPQLRAAIQRLQSPLTAFALGMSLERYVDSLGGAGSDKQDRLLQLAQAAQDRTAELLQSLRAQTRYPHFVQLNVDARRRLASPDFFLDAAKQARSRGDLSQAILRLQEGVRRHRKSQPVWQSLFETEIEQVRRGQATRDGYQVVLKELADAESQGVLTVESVNLFRGMLNERLGDFTGALNAYEQVKATTADPSQRIRSTAGAAVLRARLALEQAH